MFGGRTWLGRAGGLSIALASAFASGAATPVTDGWAAHPDDQFLLHVKLHQYRLGDGVRAYATPEGTCIVFGDFLTTLDVPMKIDLAARKASGWAFKEANSISIDAGAGRVTYGGQSEALAASAIRETPEGWCVDSSALTRWFGIDVKPVTAGSVLILESEAKLPVELAIEREKRAANLRPAKFDLTTLPQIRLPYRMWRAPALDFVVSAGATYRADSGVRVDRRASVFAAGEIARLSYDAQLSTNDKGMPGALRVRAYRSDPEGQLLGPLRATHVGIGDVQGFDSPLMRTGRTGRGALVTNRPLAKPTSFDRTRFEGDLPSGWDAEIYRNGQLLGFARSDSRQRYVFEDVQLLYGENRFEIILYGPQGQVRSHYETVNVGQENVPPGKTWYWAGVNQPGRDLIDMIPEPDSAFLPKAEAAVSVEHGLDARTSVGLLARALLVDDERVTFVEGSIRRSIGPALVEVAAARDTGGGSAARAQLLAKVGSVNISAEALAVNDFRIDGRREQTFKDVRVAVDAPLRVGRTAIPAHAQVHVRQQADGSSQVEAAARLSASVERFNLATNVRYRRQHLANGPSPPGEIIADLIGVGRVGDVRLRGSTSFELAPESRFRSAELSGYWSASDSADWEGALAYDSPQKRARARVTHIRRLDSMAVALTAEGATDGSLALGINLNFSIDPRKGLHLSRQPLAAAGVVRARVFRDLNDNGSFDPEEPLEKGALITTGTGVVPKPTDAKGTVVVGGLRTFMPLTVGIDQTSLSDPMLAPKKAIQVVVPRPGVPAEVDIPLVGGGDVEGVLVKNGGVGVEGVELELVDADGRTVSSAISDYDGFFLFERVPYGNYRVRIAEASANVLQVSPELNVALAVTADSPIVRLGSIDLSPTRIASSE